MARQRQELPGTRGMSSCAPGNGARGYRGNTPAILHVPNAHGAVVARRGKKGAVCAPADVVHTPGVPYELAQAFAVHSVP